MGAGDEVGIAARLQAAHDGGADHAAVAGDVDFRGFVHELFLSRICAHSRPHLLSGEKWHCRLRRDICLSWIAAPLRGSQ